MSPQRRRYARFWAAFAAGLATCALLIYANFCTTLYRVQLSAGISTIVFPPLGLLLDSLSLLSVISTPLILAIELVLPVFLCVSTTLATATYTRHPSYVDVRVTTLTNWQLASMLLRR